VEVEPCVVNLIWKRFPKDANHGKEHLVFMNLGTRNFTMRSNIKDEFFYV
jgi:hypothetical protein